VGRMCWRAKAEIEVSRLLLTDRRVALFLVAGNELMVVRDDSIRCGAMAKRGDTTASVLVGFYHTITAQFKDVMGDIDAARRRRNSLSAMRRRGKRVSELKSGGLV
jgi:hypothetical protein